MQWALERTSGWVPHTLGAPPQAMGSNGWALSINVPGANSAGYKDTESTVFSGD